MFKKIHRNVVVLGFVSLFTDISSEMLYPIVPIFLTSVLGAPMQVVGLIEGVAESTASILKAVSGWFSDKIKKRRPFVATGYVLSAISKPMLALAYAWPVVLFARFLDRFGKGVRTSPRDALIADSSPPEDRGTSFGFHRGMDTIGAVLGPLIAIALLKVLNGNFRTVFLVSFIPAALSVAIIAIFLKSEPPFASKGDIALQFNLRQFSPSFKKFLFVSSIFALGNSSDAFLIVRAKGIGFTTTMVILAYVAYNVTYSLFSLPFGALSDRIPRKWVMVMGYFVFACVYFGFGAAPGRSMIWVLFLVYGFYMAMTDGVSKALVSDLVEQDKRATALGVYHSLTGALSFFASLIGGFLWGLWGSSATFFYGSFMAVVSCIGFVLIFRERVHI
jgi:MFS family permease